MCIFLSLPHPSHLFFMISFLSHQHVLHSFEKKIEIFFKLLIWLKIKFIFCFNENIYKHFHYGMGYIRSSKLFFIVFLVSFENNLCYLYLHCNIFNWNLPERNAFLKYRTHEYQDRRQSCPVINKNINRSEKLGVFFNEILIKYIIVKSVSKSNAKNVWTQQNPSLLNSYFW